MPGHRANSSPVARKSLLAPQFVSRHRGKRHAMRPTLRPAVQSEPGVPPSSCWAKRVCRTCGSTPPTFEHHLERHRPDQPTLHLRLTDDTVLRSYTWGNGRASSRHGSWSALRGAAGRQRAGQLGMSCRLGYSAGRSRPRVEREGENSCAGNRPKIGNTTTGTCITENEHD
jgi:hypothetical protein